MFSDKPDRLQQGEKQDACSSKEQDGVEEIFDTAVIDAVGDEYKTPEESTRESRPAFASTGGKKAKKRSKCAIL